MNEPQGEVALGQEDARFERADCCPAASFSSS